MEERITNRNANGDLLLYGNEIYGNNQDIYNAITELEEIENLKKEGRLIELPYKIGTTVWVTPNGKSFHTGKLFGKNEKGSYLVFVTDNIRDFVQYPSSKFFYDWFKEIYTFEEVYQILGRIK